MGREYFTTIFYRFDILAGFNGQEGGVWWAYSVAPFLAALNTTTDNGIDLEQVTTFLQHRCQSMVTPLSANLCSQFIINNYLLNNATDDQDRARNLIEYLGKVLTYMLVGLMQWLRC